MNWFKLSKYANSLEVKGLCCVPIADWETDLFMKNCKLRAEIIKDNGIEAILKANMKAAREEEFKRNKF